VHQLYNNTYLASSENVSQKNIYTYNVHNEELEVLTPKLFYIHLSACCADKTLAHIKVRVCVCI